MTLRQQASRLSESQRMRGRATDTRWRTSTRHATRTRNPIGNAPSNNELSGQSTCCCSSRSRSIDSPARSRLERERELVSSSSSSIEHARCTLPSYSMVVLPGCTDGKSALACAPATPCRNSPSVSGFKPATPRCSRPCAYPTATPSLATEQQHGRERARPSKLTIDCPIAALGRQLDREAV